MQASVIPIASCGVLRGQLDVGFRKGARGELLCLHVHVYRARRAERSAGEICIQIRARLMTVCLH